MWKHQKGLFGCNRIGSKVGIYHFYDGNVALYSGNLPSLFYFDHNNFYDGRLHNNVTKINSDADVNTITLQIRLNFGTKNATINKCSKTKMASEYKILNIRIS